MARRQHNRKRRRRGRFGLFFRILTALLAAGAVAAACVVFFRVDTVTVTGSMRYTQEEIVSASGVTTGENLFALNKYDVAQNILRTLPYVSQVSISRALPTTLVITVDECAAVGCVESGGHWWLLNDHCKVMEQTDAPQGMVLTGLAVQPPSVGAVLTVGEEDAVRFQSLRDMMQELDSQQLLTGLNSADLSDPSRITLRYEDRITVRVGYQADYGYKMKALRAAVDYLEDYEVCTVDLTYADGPHIFS